MMSVGERLVEHARSFAKTGNDMAIVVVEHEDSTKGLHHVSFDPYVGLLIDGAPPTLQWYRSVEDFQPMMPMLPVLH